MKVRNRWQVHFNQRWTKSNTHIIAMLGLSTTPTTPAREKLLLNMGRMRTANLTPSTLPVTGYPIVRRQARRERPTNSSRRVEIVAFDVTPRHPHSMGQTQCTLRYLTRTHTMRVPPLHGITKFRISRHGQNTCDINRPLGLTKN